jgi:hypothetical protein
MLCETHTKGVLCPTHSSVKFLPFEEAGDHPFLNVDFEVSGHEKSSNEVKAESIQLREALMDIQQGI